MEEVEELLELAMLYDFYGELLKEHNKRIFEDYILNDLSLSEIADMEGITRQGVHDIVKRCSKQLKEYEEELHLVEKFRKTKSKMEEVQKLLNDAIHENNFEYIGRAKNLTDDILSEL